MGDIVPVLMRIGHDLILLVGVAICLFVMWLAGALLYFLWSDAYGQYVAPDPTFTTNWWVLIIHTVVVAVPGWGGPLLGLRGILRSFMRSRSDA